MLVSHVLAAVAAIALLVSKKATRKDGLPFGPFFYLGYLVTILAGMFLSRHRRSNEKTRLVALVALVVVCIAGWAILVLNTMNEVKNAAEHGGSSAVLPREKTVPAFAAELPGVPLRNPQRRCTMSIWQPVRNITRTARREMCAHRRIGLCVGSCGIPGARRLLGKVCGNLL